MRLLAILRREHGEREFTQELEAHLALDIEAGIRAGLSSQEARRQALIRLGGAEQARQSHRERRALPVLENFLYDLRYSVRTLRRAPGFTLTAVLTLALGIGACTAVFSLVNAVLLRSLPYGEPERLVYLFTPSPTLKNIPDEVICPGYGDFYDVMRESRSYEKAANFEQAMFRLAGKDGAQRIGSARVDENFFSTLEAAPELGRELSAEDQQPGHERVAVISHALWRSMFGGAETVLGRSLELDGKTYRIVGIMGPGFEYPFHSDLPYGDSEIKSTHIWVPLALTPKQRAQRGPGNNVTLARLRPGVTVRQAQNEFDAIMQRLDKQFPQGPPFEGNRDWRGLVQSFLGLSIGPVRPLMRLLLAAVGLVLFIACGNAANLLLARTAARARELGVRAALGASRQRIIRQTLADSLLICSAGGALGVALAFLFLRVLPRIDPGNIPRLNEASLDPRVLLATLAASLLTALLTGLLPALHATRLQPTDVLRPHGVQGKSGGHGRVQGTLIIAQTAMVVVLLAAAGLLLRSYVNVITIDTGFSPQTITLHVTPGSGYTNDAQRRAFWDNLFTRLRGLPGVVAAGGVSNLPLTNSESLGFVWAEGYPNRKDQLLEGRVVTPGYLEAMQIPVVAGRAFTTADDDKAHVAIINEAFARTYFAGRSALHGRISHDDAHKQWDTVIGIIGDVRHNSLEEAPKPQFYTSNPRIDFEDLSVAVRSTLPAATTEAEIRSALHSLDPNIALVDLQTMGDLESQASARRRFQTSLLTAFALIALVLALVGLYGVMAYAVSRRTREVGIRMALGAQRSDVLLLVLKKAGLLVGAGLAAGLACTFVATRALRSFLFGISDHDPATILTVSALLMVCGLLAALVPARRAASADPMQSLRAE
jgi:predicted permease